MDDKFGESASAGAGPGPGALEGSRPSSAPSVALQNRACSGRYELPLELTVCIPTYNGILTLPRCLEALLSGRQSVPLEVLVLEGSDNGPSTDGTVEYLAAEATRLHWIRRGLRDFRVLAPVCADVATAVAPLGEHERNVEEQASASAYLVKARTAMALAVGTPWLMWLDDDILVPPGGVRALLNAAKSYEEPGLIGMMSDPVQDHVQEGCAVMWSAVAQFFARSGWGRAGCTGRWLNRRCAELGLVTGFLKGWEARHLRWEMAGMGYRGTGTRTRKEALIVKGLEGTIAALKAVGFPIDEGALSQPGGNTSDGLARPGK